MKNRLKRIIKKIPLIRAAAKYFYDWRNEKCLQSRIKSFRERELPHVREAPLKYGLGHEPTIRCNLKCKMCYQGQTRELRRSELETGDVLKIYEKLRGKVSLIKLVGGEPLVRQDISDLLAFWDKEGVRIVLQTNCILLDENNVGLLRNFKNLKDIATSLDGPENVHDAVRGVPGTFSRLKKAISVIKRERPDIPITVFATLVEDNMDKLCELVDTCKELGLDSVNILFEQVYRPADVEAARKIFESIFGWRQGDYRLNTQTREKLFPDNLDSKILREKLSRARSYGIKRGCFVNFVPFNYYNNLDKYLGEKPGRVFCLKLLHPELRINQQGEAVWCDIIEKSFGSLLDKTPEEIWLSDDFQKFRTYLAKNSLPICSRCCKASYI